MQKALYCRNCHGRKKVQIKEQEEMARLREMVSDQSRINEDLKERLRNALRQGEE